MTAFSVSDFVFVQLHFLGWKDSQYKVPYSVSKSKILNAE
jgi:hypothetical protein